MHLGTKLSTLIYQKHSRQQKFRRSSFFNCLLLLSCREVYILACFFQRVASERFAASQQNLCGSRHVYVDLYILLGNVKQKIPLSLALAISSRYLFTGNSPL